VFGLPSVRSSDPYKYRLIWDFRSRSDFFFGFGPFTVIHWRHFSTRTRKLAVIFRFGPFMGFARDALIRQQEYKTRSSNTVESNKKPRADKKKI
jgi:hypothetical protein